MLILVSYIFKQRIKYTSLNFIIKGSRDGARINLFLKKTMRNNLLTWISKELE